MHFFYLAPEHHGHALPKACLRFPAPIGYEPFEGCMLTHHKGDAHEDADNLQRKDKITCVERMKIDKSWMLGKNNSNRLHLW